jgi:surface protein
MKQSFLFILSIFIFLSLNAQGEFITRWQLPTGQTSITFNLGIGSGGANYTWETVPSGQTGSGNFSTAGYSAQTITGLPSGMNIRLSIEATNLDAFLIQGGADRKVISDIEQWGNATWVTMNGAFAGCENLNISASDVPNLSQCSDLSWMFRACLNLNSPANINSWNVSTITNMERMFELASQFNQPIGDWNTSLVTNMTHLFSGASAFNQPIGAWNTSNVTSMTNMFASTSFNQPIGTWITSNVSNMAGMFQSANSFNQSLANWNTANVTNMNMLFANTSSFNQPIDNWNTSNVENFNGMFYNAVAFNQPIGNWDTGSASDMFGMFWGASSFNQPINNWDLGNVTKIGSMFLSASSFNQSLTNWNTANVTSMSGTFLNASSFNQNVGNWNFTNTTNMSNMFDNSGIECDIYGDMLSSWAGNSTLPVSLTIGVLNLYYIDGDVSARNSIISQNSITLSGDMNAGLTCATASLDENSLSVIDVFPNPANNILTIRNEGLTSIQITSSNGANIAHIELNEDTAIDVSSYSPGVYYLRTSEGQTVKFIKQ